jgi:hypothetical protein
MVAALACGCGSLSRESQRGMIAAEIAKIPSPFAEWLRENGYLPKSKPLRA